MVSRLRHLRCNGEKFGGIGAQPKEVHDQYLVDQLLIAALLCILDYLQYDFDMVGDSRRKSLADTIRYILKNVHSDNSLVRCWADRSF